MLGWYAKDDTVRAAKGMGAQFRSTANGDASRLYDSRKDPDNGNLPFVGGDVLDLTDTWASPAEAATIKAYAVNITATAATGSGVFTAWAGGGVAKPLASTVNYQKGITAPNMVVVPAGHFTRRSHSSGGRTRPASASPTWAVARCTCSSTWWATT